ncbi:MAG: hypothetical protein ABI705_13535 [Aestuariivirga sp.]
MIYKDKFYLLRTPEELEMGVREHLALKGGVIFPGGSLYHYDQNQRFEPFHFINITTHADSENYRRLRLLWMESDAFKGKLKLSRLPVQILTWCLISEQHKSEIIQLLESTREVVRQGLEVRLEEADALAVVFHQNTVIACGALKSPSDLYRLDAFKRSNSNLLPEHYPLELGYVAVSGKMRKNGIGPAITRSLVELRGKSGIYATTRSTNRKMQTILLQNGFNCVGLPYKSKRGKYSLMLWVRKP